MGISGEGTCLPCPTFPTHLMTMTVLTDHRVGFTVHFILL